ncbi:hypothetical protein ACFYXC_18370 [Streptomyces sp. NPDC002701]
MSTGELLYGHSGAVSSVAFSPYGSLIATAGHDHWDCRTIG